MGNMFFEYNNQKIKEVVLYILSKAGDTGYFRLMKIMFCADRQNLLRWGDQITNLDYYESMALFPQVFMMDYCLFIGVLQANSRIFLQ